MNLISVLEEDKTKIGADFFEPQEIVSLLEVLRIYADDFVLISRLLANIEASLDDARRIYPDRKHVDIPPIEELVRQLHHHSKRMKLKVTTDRTEDVLHLLHGQQVEIGPMIQVITKVLDKFYGELNEEVFFKLRSDRISLFIGKQGFLNKEIVKALPEIRDENRQAKRCFATEKYTDAAFHLMRVMESVIQAFAAKVYVPFNPDKDTWGSVLGKIHDKIDSWDKKHGNYPYKKKYKACYRLMDGIRPARDDLIHRHQNYSEDGVRNLKGAVELSIQAFLNLPDLPPFLAK